MSFIHILMTFYKKKTMIYVGKNWKGTGHLLLIGLCAYCAIFIAYSWSKHAKSTYSSFYRPVLEVIPPVKYNDGHFEFNTKMPAKINHPITDNKAVYIDTSTDELPDEAWEYRVVISKEQFVISDLPVLFNDHWSKHNLIFFLFSSSPFDGNEFPSKDKIIEACDNAAGKAHFSLYILSFSWTLFLELCKTTFITLIVMFMFKNGAIKSNKHRDFKLVNRLCVLTYIPVLLTNSLYSFLMTTPGIFMLITTSFVHIILLMTAIHVNVMDDANETALKQ